MTEMMTYEDTFQMRQNYIGKSCKLHFEVAPLKIVRASKQYMFDDQGNEYLDCISNVSHVGHCHPHVVNAGQEQMATLTTCSGFLNDSMALYAKRIIETLPNKLCICYFVNSGSEANDLALRLAKAYTKREDVMVIDNSYHGNLGNLIDVSPLRFKGLGVEQKKNVHVVPCPDLYRGVHREDDGPEAAQAYAHDVIRALGRIQANGRKIGAFLCEPLMSLCGVVVPPPTFLPQVYGYVREAGGVCIADEIQTGLGRIGDHYWAFQACGDAVPDILTCGKPMGNGHPMAMVVTTREIADSMTGFMPAYGGNPVSCAIGLAVLDVIQNEKLISSAKSVGRTLLEGFRAIQHKHPMMGDVRGMGLIVGVEIVTDKESRKPAKDAAELATYKMKQEKILIANAGPDKNVLILTPPMCFTCDNARRVVLTLDRCLAEIEKPDLDLDHLPTTQLTIPMDVLNGDLGGQGVQEEEEEDEEEEGNYGEGGGRGGGGRGEGGSRDNSDGCPSHPKRPRYEDLD